MQSMPWSLWPAKTFSPAITASLKAWYKTFTPSVLNHTRGPSAALGQKIAAFEKHFYTDDVYKQMMSCTFIFILGNYLLGLDYIFYENLLYHEYYTYVNPRVSAYFHNNLNSLVNAAENSVDHTLYIVDFNELPQLKCNSKSIINNIINQNRPSTEYTIKSSVHNLTNSQAGWNSTIKWALIGLSAAICAGVGIALASNN